MEKHIPWKKCTKESWYPNLNNRQGRLYVKNCYRYRGTSHNEERSFCQEDKITLYLKCVIPQSQNRAKMDRITIISKFTLTVGDFNISVSITNRQEDKTIIKDIEGFINIINKFDLIGIFRTVSHCRIHVSFKCTRSTDKNGPNAGP